MSEDLTIGVLVGSLRSESFNRKTAFALAEVAPDGLSFDHIPVGDLPLYNEDLETDDPPAAWTTFRERVGRTQGILFVTPEYNRSVPACLKNAIDVGSRPGGKSCWLGKPAAVVSVSPGAIGGFGANHHLRQSLVFLDMPVMQQPEAYIGGAGKLFGEDGKLINENSRPFFSRIMESFAAHVRLHCNRGD